MTHATCPGLLLPRPPRARLLRLACATAAGLLACAGPALAQSPRADAGQPLWELGVLSAGISQQAYPGSDEQVRRATLLPFGIYRGRLLRADGNTAGLRAVKTDSFELDIGFSGAFGAGGRGLAARQGMPRLGTLLEFGPRADLPLRAVLDVSDGFGSRGWSLEPELTWERRQGGWRLSVSGSAILADRKLADTFYGVAPSEAIAGRPAYEAKAGLVAWRLATGFTRDLSPDWRLFGFARVDTVQGAANRDSPLVRQTTGATVGLGVSYTWLRSAARAQD